MDQKYNSRDSHCTVGIQRDGEERSVKGKDKERLELMEKSQERGEVCKIY